MSAMQEYCEADVAISLRVRLFFQVWEASMCYQAGWYPVDMMKHRDTGTYITRSRL